MVAKVLYFLVLWLLCAVHSHGFAVHPQPDIRQNATISYTVLKETVQTADVMVKWNGIRGDQSDDFVSVWLSGANFTYVRYANASTPFGETNFTLLNVPKQSYVFRYFRGDLLVTSSEAYTMAQHVPLMPRLTMTENPSEMVIRYTTDRFVKGSTGCKIRGSGRREWNTILASGEDITTYTQQDFLDRSNLPPLPIRRSPFTNFSQRRKLNVCRDSWCYNADTAATLFVDPGIFVNIKVTKLQPGQVYEYTCGELHDTSNILLPVRQFRATLESTTPDIATKIVWTADAGTGHGVGNGRRISNCSTANCVVHDPWGGSVVGGMVYEGTPWAQNKAALVWKALDEKISKLDDPLAFIVFGGDVTYNRGWGSYNWQLFAHETVNIAGHVPVLAFNGNHDLDWQLNPLQGAGVNGNDSGGEGGIALARWYGLPLNGSWSVRKAGSIAWIALDSELPPAPQLEWLEHVVTPNLNRSETPWVVVSLHRPLVKNNMNVINNLLVSYFSDWLDRHADVILFGHDHFYGRYYPLAFSAVPNPAVCVGVPSDGRYRQQCRVSFEEYNEQQLNPEWTLDHPQCLERKNFLVSSRNECRSWCANNTRCEGIELVGVGKELTCQLLSCSVTSIARQGGIIFNPNEASSVSSMLRQAKAAPVYILDGSAGQTGETPSSGPHGDPVDSRYETLIHCPANRLDSTFYDCQKYGWTEVTANKTHLVASHFHFDSPNTAVDDVTLEQ